MLSMEDMRKVMREGMSAMRGAMSTSMKDEMNTMKTAMNELQKSLANKLKSLLETENEKLKTLVVEQGTRIKKLEADNDLLNKMMNAHEQYSRRSNVQINNIPSVQGESIEAIVSNAKIFYEARKIVKGKKAKSTWTEWGNIHQEDGSVGSC
ncbi:hypothetical protein M8J75_002676 [Diaphorina citri]|nr:hypothetical protein M8J75_002676 [Diaphorina citri]